MRAITTHAAGITKGHGEVVLAMGLRTSVYDIWRRNGKKELKKLLVLHCESTFQLLVKPLLWRPKLLIVELVPLYSAIPGKERRKLEEPNDWRAWPMSELCE